MILLTGFRWYGLLTGIFVAVIYLFFTSLIQSVVVEPSVVIISLLAAVGYGGFVGLVSDSIIPKILARVIVVGALTPVFYNLIQVLLWQQTYDIYMFGENLLIGTILGLLAYLILRRIK